MKFIEKGLKRFFFTQFFLIFSLFLLNQFGIIYLNDSYISKNNFRMIYIFQIMFILDTEPLYL